VARRVTPIQTYVGALGVAVGALVAFCLADLNTDEPVRWLAFAVLFGVAEGVDIFFYHPRGRQSLNPSETMLLPMVAVLPFSQVVLAVTAAMVAIRILHWREGALRFVFNVAQYGLASAAAAGVWAAFGTSGGQFTLRDALAASIGVAVFALLSHILTAGAIAISEKAAMLDLLRDVTGAAAVFLASNMLLGLLLAAAYFAAPWSLALFPPILFLLALASRAVLAQTRDRERAEHLHTAARALAVGLDVEAAVSGFVAAVLDLMSAAEVVAIAHLGSGPTGFRVRRGETGRTSEQVRDPALLRVPDTLSAGSYALVTADSRSGAKSIADLFGARSLVAVPLIEGERVVGALVALDHLGTEDYRPEDARLLEALAHELVLSLESFSLFDQVLTERERFGQIFTGSKEGICLLDEDGRVEAWNPALERMTGFGENEMLGTMWSDRLTLLKSDGRGLTGAEIATASPDDTLELVTHQGASMWVSVFPGPVTAADGSGWVVLIRDVTAERNLEQAKMDFLSTMSHELRTPMTGLKGSLDVLRSDVSNLSDDQLERLIRVMSWGAERLDRLVVNLLIVSEISAGDMPMKWAEVDLGDVARRRVAETLGSHEMVEVVSPDEAIVARVDSERLAQALDHVLENALKFGGRHGKITVAVAVTDGLAEIEVIDEGPGVPIVDRDRIFERFVRLGDVMTRQTQGAGVGLFIAKRSIEAMGGTIAVDDAEIGARFRIRLPLAASGEASPEARRVSRGSQ
jgi:PAS domain S-box-containing protein